MIRIHLIESLEAHSLIILRRRFVDIDLRRSTSCLLSAPGKKADDAGRKCFASELMAA
jgi:hypothetical protein